MGVFDPPPGGAAQRSDEQPMRQSGKFEDEQAIARYRYLLRTAPPETIEQTHAEAFAKLTPEQRRIVLSELGNELPQAESNALLGGGDSPQALARMATRAELRQPGAIERTFERIGAAPGLGSVMVGTFFSTMAGAVLGTAIAQSFLSHRATDAGGNEFVQDAGAESDGDAGSVAGAGDVGGAFDADDVGGIDV